MPDWESESDDHVLAADASDPAAFSAFYRRYERPVLGYFVRRTRDPELSADLTAEVFASALEACPRYQPRRAPASATVTYYFAGRHAGRPVTVRAIGNVFIVPLGRRPPEDAFAAKMVWRSATGAVIQTISGA